MYLQAILQVQNKTCSGNGQRRRSVRHENTAQVAGGGLVAAGEGRERGQGRPISVMSGGSEHDVPAGGNQPTRRGLRADCR